MRVILLFLVLLAAGLPGRAQSVKPAAINEDYTLNPPASGKRTLRYRPAGSGVEIVDGERRFNRALYGAHTGFRLECSDRPEFGLYLPRMGGNLQFDLDYSHCRMRYEAGRVTYWLDDRIEIEAQVLRQKEDAALWRITNRGTEAETFGIRYGGLSDKKFYREGDLGVDDPECFSFRSEDCAGNVYRIDGNRVRVEYGRKERSELQMTLPTDRIRLTGDPSLEARCTLAAGEVRYLAIAPASNRLDLSAEALAERFAEAEAERARLANTLKMKTPDPYITPIGGAMALAADGLWSGKAWLHGAIGWRTPYSGWRGAYVGDALGRHELARIHFDTYAANQITDIEPRYPHPRQDSTLGLSRAEKRWGTPMYSTGYITRRPGRRDEMSHYDMNLCYIDELLRHLRWTGDKEYARRIFPVIERHLAWEKRNFDPDGDHLYDAYCCIWASDALYYAGGAVTHSSAYNYYANREAAAIAELIGADPAPYRAEAEAILGALNRTLWMEEQGHWAEHRDRMGHRRLHPDAALWTIYHAIDSECGDAFQAYAATRYIDRKIPRIAVRAEGLDDGDYAVLPTSRWKPYSWSINNVAIAEILHTALSYWQAGRAEEAFRLMKSTALDNMYLGASPLNFGQISYYDAARGECYRDFGDPIGVWSRALVEGLYGIRPDALHGRLELRPGFPEAWNEAEISMSDVAYGFRREGACDTYEIRQSFDTLQHISLVIPARGAVRRVTVDGRKACWQAEEPSIERARIVIDAGAHEAVRVQILWQPLPEAEATGRERIMGPVRFVEQEAAQLRWWRAEALPEPETEPRPAGFEAVDPERCEPVEMVFNASVSDIFRNRYLSPRPPCTTLQIPEQGIGEWCHPKQTAEIDDSGLRAAVNGDGMLHTAPGVPFRTPKNGPNIYYTTLWDNYPDRCRIPLSGRASHAYLMMAGSTNHMQYGLPNGEVRIRYRTGEAETLQLTNPSTWVPIEQDIYYDEGAFRLEEGTTPPYRIHLGSGRASRHLGDELGIGGVYGRLIDGGAGILLDIGLDPERELEALELETLSNDVVIGLMAITLQRN